jgi:hypothetical protein
MHIRSQLAYLSCLLFLLAACGQASQGSSHSTPTSPPTQSGGPVSISTDHSQYAADQAINVTVHNGLSAPLYALDTRSGCSILQLEMQVAGKWQTSSRFRCLLGRRAALVTIDAGKTYAATINPTGGGSFPAGTYRFVLNYTQSPTQADLFAKPIKVASESFTLAALGTPGAVPTSGTAFPPPTQ